MQNPVMIFTKLLVRTSGWLLGATVLHLRGDFANFPLDQSIILFAVKSFVMLIYVFSRKQLEGTRITLVKM